jgi:hypothetical protein
LFPFNFAEIGNWLPSCFKPVSPVRVRPSEIVTQLRGEAEGRQVEGAKVGLIENGGGVTEDSASGMYDLKSCRGTARLEQSEPRQEREFSDRRPRVVTAALPRTETEIGQTEASVVEPKTSINALAKPACQTRGEPNT